jgi:hypothetical protein
LPAQRVIRGGLALEFFEKRFLCSICRVAPLSKGLIPVNRQRSFPAVNFRRLHTRRLAKFKREMGIPAVNFDAWSRFCGFAGP